MANRSWCFTTYKLMINYDTSNIKYLVYQEEICPKTKRHHIQGYIELTKKVRASAIKKIFSDSAMHVETRKGTREQAINYCKKEESRVPGTSFHEYGDPTITQGTRTDLRRLYDQLKDRGSLADILDDNPEAFIKYSRGIQYAKQILDEKYQKEQIQEEFKNFIPNEFQKEILHRLENQNNRRILWVCDEKGGKGKTYLSRFLVSSGAFRCSGGKNNDIAYAYKGEHTFIMDLSRSMEEHTNYDIIEQIKNGMIFSGKYESRNKIFKVPKVLILANFMPDLSKLSEDRWDIYNPKCTNVPKWWGNTKPTTLDTKKKELNKERAPRVARSPIPLNGGRNVSRRLACLSPEKLGQGDSARRPPPNPNNVNRSARERLRAASIEKIYIDDDDKEFIIPP